jgi:hypothetical protein
MRRGGTGRVESIRPIVATLATVSSFAPDVGP